MEPPNRDHLWGLGTVDPGEALPVTTTAPAGALPGASAEAPLSVGAFSATVRARVEATYGARGVWVEGEVRECTFAKSGHVYFTLRDPQGTDIVRCALWRTARVGPRDRDAVANGAHLVVHGKASVFTGKSEIQILVDAVRLAGRGALLEARERLKAQLEAEGLFAAERKRALPRDPRMIGLVTSPTGAVVHDVRTVAFQRGGAHLLLAPAVVQGPTAPESIVAALARVASVEEVDVIIVGRGGGAAEDLACFDDERVVRAIAACPKPVVSAVGHETDFSLADLAADVRAATPSQAAELTVPAAAPRVTALGDAKRRLWRALKERMRLAREELREGREGLDPVLERVREGERLVDALDASLRDRTHARMRDGKRELDALAARLQAVHPAAKLAAQQRRAHEFELRLRRAGERLLTTQARDLQQCASALAPLAQERTAAAREDLARAAASLHALSPLAILSRGYSLVTNASGAAVRRADDAPAGTLVHVRAAEVRFDARVVAAGGETEPR